MLLGCQMFKETLLRNNLVNECLKGVWQLDHNLPEKDRIFCSGVPHQLDHLVQEDGDGGNAHAVRDAQNRSGLEQRVS